MKENPILKFEKDICDFLDLLFEMLGNEVLDNWTKFD